jgi:uncharacterized iron-regulated membrane protein
MRLRPVFFWTHLTAGAVAGLVILIMCVTGVLLTYERQLYAWYDRGFQSAAVPAGATRLPMADLLARVQAQAPDAAPASVTIDARADAPVTIVAGTRTLYVDAYSGHVLGESRAQGVRRFMSSVKAWHRWLAVEGDGRPSARAVTGWSNLLFLFVVASGIYLWMPRAWTWSRVKAITLFNGRLRGKARDFNWHNVIGSWSAIPLLIVVLSAVPISFPWANAALYRAMGEQVPTAGGRDGGPGARAGAAGARGAEGNRPANAGGANQSGRNDAPAQGAATPDAGRRSEGGRGTAEADRAVIAVDGFDRWLARARQQEPDWRTISLRLPASSAAPLALAIDRGNGGQPQLRSTLTLARDGEVVGYEDFGSQTPARRARSIMRFAHTGEVLGLTGQTIAGLATAGGTVLVYTGIALAFRRFRAWLSRRSRPAAQDARNAA